MPDPPPRIIHLRRPPVLQVQDEPFVPARASLDETERRWRALRAQNPAYFDGRIYHVLGVHRNGCGGATVHVMPCAYRFHAVQDASFDLGVRPLGIKGIIKRGGAFLLGRRACNVAHYPTMWEFAPGGVVEAGSTPAETLRRELHEEVGLEPAREPTAIAMIFDDLLHTWEIIYSISLDESQQPHVTPEYSEVAWCSRENLPSNLSPLAAKMIPLL